MNSFSHDRLVKRIVALLGATGLAAFSGLPAFAQVNTNNSVNDGVLNPNPSILNEYPYNRGMSPDATQQTGRSVDCSAYINGGIGGPIDNGSSDQVSVSATSNNADSSQSSYDTATIPQNRSEAMNQPSPSASSYDSNRMSRDGQFSAHNPNAAIPFRTNGPAGTAGGESNLNSAPDPQNRPVAMNSSDSSYGAMNSMTSSSNYDSNGMSRDGQFSAHNPNAAIPFRMNGPAGTAGGESNLNLHVSNADNGLSKMQSAMPSEMTNRAYSAPDRSSSNQSANPIPVECLPGGVNNR